MPTEAPDRLIDVKELGYLLGVSRATVYHWLRTNPLFPHPRPIGPRTSRWSLAEVMAWMEGQHEGALPRS